MATHVMLSIRPWFVKDILSGRKRYEYRNYCPDRETDFLVVYETRPRQVVSTVLEVRQILSGRRSYIWRRTREFSGTDKEGYYSYARPFTHSIELGTAYPLAYELRLNELPFPCVPPQGFIYLTDEQMEFFLKRI